ncbi:hypothetical protein M5K25_006779 [Dendrobium thyrsiflorum]|uniref:Uncharacterized protein n=1 Tax=Dendrobium thyrsiflorum TaxID=117978 RepID=A0ABD0VDN9_DENTH
MGGLPGGVLCLFGCCAGGLPVADCWPRFACCPVGLPVVISEKPVGLPVEISVLILLPGLHSCGYSRKVCWPSRWVCCPDELNCLGGFWSPLLPIKRLGIVALRGVIEFRCFSQPEGDLVIPKEELWPGGKVLEGELGQLKTDFEEKISDFQNQFTIIHEKMDGRFVALKDLMKKMIEDKQKTATSKTTGGHGRGGNPNPFRGRKNSEVKVLEGEDGMPPLEPLSTEEMSMGYDRKGAYFVGRMEEYHRRGAEFEGGREEIQRRGLLANSSIPSDYLRTQVFPIRNLHHNLAIRS